MSFISDVRMAIANLAAQQPGSTAAGSPSQSPSALNTTKMLLDENVQVTLDGNGNGTARISPHGARMGGTTWSVTNVYVSAATNVSEAACTLYVSRGIQSATVLDCVGQTSTGSSGDTFANSFDTRPGDWITAIWNGGDAGTIATMTIKGTVNPQ